MSQHKCPMPFARTKRLLSMAILLGMYAAGAATMAVGAETQAPTPKRGGILEFAVDSEPGTYDCHANVSFAFLHPIAPHYSTLLKFDGANYPQIKGNLAESWSVSADKLTYTFKIHPNVLFHDGSALTSADVKASYERRFHPPQRVVSSRQDAYAAIARNVTPAIVPAVFKTT